MTKTQLERLQVIHDRLSQINTLFEEIFYEGDMALNEFSVAQEDKNEYMAVKTLIADVEEMDTIVDIVKFDIENLLETSK